MGKSRIVCAWCKRVIRETEYEGPDSHGICLECKKAVETELEEAAKFNKANAAAKMRVKK